MPAFPQQHSSAERQTLDEIYEWYAGMLDSLSTHRAHVRAALADGTDAGPRFLGFSAEDVDRYFEGQRAELDRLTKVNLVGSTEASIRLDLGRRIYEQLKDDLSKSYKAWYTTLSPVKQKLPDFDEEGILDRIKDAKVLDSNIVGRFRECLKSRHWIVHGRYFLKHANVDQFSPEEVRDRCQKLVNAIEAVK